MKETVNGSRLKRFHSRAELDAGNDEFAANARSEDMDEDEDNDSGVKQRLRPRRRSDGPGLERMKSPSPDHGFLSWYRLCNWISHWTSFIFPRDRKSIGGGSRIFTDLQACNHHLPLLITIPFHIYICHSPLKLWTPSIIISATIHSNARQLEGP
jgi:hypothetical protein